VKKNRVIQFSLVIAIIILFFFFFFSGDKDEIIDADKSSDSTKNANKLTEEASNIIENVSYKGNNNEGTFFELRAAIAEIRHDEPNLSRLKDVFVVIRLKNLKIIHIEADEGIFDKVSSDSNFFGNVKISDEQNNVITSDNLDFYNSKNLLQAYNKVIYTGKKGNLIADQVLVDI
jgi:LPS export ABC transporter protein LptC